MSREIKFRVYDQTSKDYTVYGIGEVVDGHFGLGIISRIVWWLKGIKHKFIIEQYTGLKDKNGKEIYEGDIVKYLNTNYEVYFDKVQGWRGIRRGSHSVIPIGETVYNMTINQVSRPEVIGNIHENPELLENKS